MGLVNFHSFKIKIIGIEKINLMKHQFFLKLLIKTTSLITV